MALKLFQLISIKQGTIFFRVENMQQNLVPDPFLVFVNIPKQPLHATLERYHQKALKGLLVFSISVPFNRQDYEK